MSKFYVVAVTAKKSVVRHVIRGASLEAACREFLTHPSRRSAFAAHVLRCGDTGQRLTVSEATRVVQSQLIRECVDPSAEWARINALAA